MSTVVHYPVDAAILDVNVQNEWVFPVAHALAAAGIEIKVLAGPDPKSPYPRAQCPIRRAIREQRECRLDTEAFWRQDGTAFAAEYAAAPKPGKK